MRLAIGSVAIWLMGVLAASAYGLPSTFWGVVPQHALTLEQMRTLKTGGVDSLRVGIYWGGVQAGGAGTWDWSAADGQIEAATKAGLKVLPTVSGAPPWAVPVAPVPGTGGSTVAPARLPASGSSGAAWSAFLRAAARRYGPSGSFWVERPLLPRRPLRTWQIWNEANFKYFVARPRPGEYGTLVERSFTALRGVDPGSKIVLGGLFAFPREGGWRAKPRQAYYATDFLEGMFRSHPKIAGRFSAVALHPYSSSYRDLAVQIDLVRDVLKVNGASKAELWITEIGWSAEPASSSNSFAKGPRGQAREL